MCKHVVLIPMKATDSAMQKKTWKPALCRIWRAGQRALNLEHCPASHFATCQWQTVQRPTTYYLIYRWLLFLSLVTIGVASFACQSLPRHYKGPMKELNYWKWFIYFTNWGYLTIIVQSALALAVVHWYRAEKSLSISSDDDDNLTPSSRRPRTPLICRAYWLAQIIATDLAFVITLVYWSLVHNPEIHEVNTLNLLVHGGNSIVMLCELAVTMHPIRLAHALYGASAGLAYGLFSALYWALGGTDRTGLQAIYPTLDWNKPGVAIGFVSMCAVVMVCAHAFATGLVALRIRIAARLLRSRLHLDKLTLPTH